MMPATVNVSHEEVQRRLKALGISQNAMARAIRKDPGHVSRVLHGAVTSAIVQRRVQGFLERAGRRAASDALLNLVHTDSEEVQRRLKALGISQNDMARAIRKDPAHVSRVLHGFTTSSIVQRRVQGFLERAELRAGLVSHTDTVEQGSGQVIRQGLSA